VVALPFEPPDVLTFAKTPLPGKKPLIKHSYRAPNYETLVEYFRDVITPNDVFFVRYPSVRQSRGGRQNMEARSRRRRRERQGRAHPE
jgi:hypothetical protein